MLDAFSGHCDDGIVLFGAESYWDFAWFVASVSVEAVPPDVAQSCAVTLPWSGAVMSSLKPELGGRARTVSSDGDGVGAAAEAVSGATASTRNAATQDAVHAAHLID